jgi:hypothetical protein
MHDTLIYWSGDIKALGDGRIAGYLIRFGDPKKTDLTGDYFPPSVDIDYYEGKQISLYYNHALDPVIKNRKIGKATLKNDDVGWWLEGQLSMRDEYERAVYGMVEAGKMGFSSGSAPHLVERKSVGKAQEIVAWPVIEASLTPTPAEPMNGVFPLKALLPKPKESHASDLKGLFEQELTERSLSVWDLWSVLNRVFCEIAKGAGSTNVTGVPVDVASLVVDAVSSFSTRVAPAVVGQIRDYVEKGSEGEFYVKGFERAFLQSFLSNGSAASHGPFIDHSEEMASVAEEFAKEAGAFLDGLIDYTERAKGKAKFRAEKSGRMISQANLDRIDGTSGKIDEIIGHLTALRDDLKDLTAAAAKPKQEMPGEVVGQKADPEHVRKLRLEFLRTQAAEIGIAA